MSTSRQGLETAARVRADELQAQVVEMEDRLEEARRLLAVRRRRSRRVVTVSCLTLALLVLVAAVRVKGGDLEIWPIDGSSPSLSYKLKLIGTGPSGTQRAMSLQNVFPPGNGTTHRLAISNNDAAERVSLTNGGLLGIGITEPGYMLDVSGTARITGEVTFPSRDCSFFATLGPSYVAITSTAPTQVMFPQVIHNDCGAYDGSSSTFTAPVAGVYHFSVNVLSMAVTEERTLSLTLWKNGIAYVPLHYQQTGHAAGAYLNLQHRTIPASVTLKLAANDRIILKIASSDGSYYIYGSAAQSANYTNFSGYRVY